jgi:hypothetical protein
MVLSIFQLQSFYCNEIKRGFSGIGEYTISPEFQAMQIQEMDGAMYRTVSLEEIVTHIRNGMHESVQLPSISIDQKEDINQDFSTSMMSTKARAQEILNTDRISFDSKLHCFMVKGTSGVVRVVTLFPSETCSCPSTGQCYHILAARLCVGMTDSKKYEKLNLTQLKKNTRSRSDKKSGRKRPRPKDENSNPG